MKKKEAALKRPLFFAGIKLINLLLRLEKNEQSLPTIYYNSLPHFLQNLSLYELIVLQS